MPTYQSFYQLFYQLMCLNCILFFMPGGIIRRVEWDLGGLLDGQVVRWVGTPISPSSVPLNQGPIAVRITALIQLSVSVAGGSGGRLYWKFIVIFGLEWVPSYAVPHCLSRLSILSISSFSIPYLLSLLQFVFSIVLKGHFFN